jgi:hypothetical protein
MDQLKKCAITDKYLMNDTQEAKEHQAELDATPRCALDNYNKRERDWDSIRHLFVNDNQFEFFKLLPGTDELKEQILLQEIKKNEQPVRDNSGTRSCKK